MTHIKNPAPLAGGNRAIKTDFIGREIKKEYSPFPHWKQPLPVKPYGIDAAITKAPDETLHRIICLHWNIPSKQELLRKIAHAKFQPGFPANDNRRASQ